MAPEETHVAVGHGPKPGKKYFTVDEANRALPYVARVVDDIATCYRDAVDVRQRIEQPGIEDEVDRLKAEYESAMDRLNDLVDELQHANVELKDFERGLVDFPARHDGREIYLCWHRGEESVQAWHEIDAGYAGRQDVTTLGTV